MRKNIIPLIAMSLMVAGFTVYAAKQPNFLIIMESEEVVKQDEDSKAWSLR
jgi:hypothetical protein